MNTEKSSSVKAIDFFCIGFGAIVGVGWAVSINSWMVGSGGPLPAAAGYMLALIMMIPVALCYCELCAMLPVSGGGMAYAFRAFGDKMSFVAGWAALGAFITIIPWEAIYVVDILSILFPQLKAGSELYTLAGVSIYPGHIIVGTVISIILYLINRRGVAASAILQRVLCFILVGAGILAMICSLFSFDVSNLFPVYENIGTGAHSSFIGGALSILASAPFFLAGFETIPQGIESAGGNLKSVGKTVVATVAFACIFYALLLVTLGGAMPWQDFSELGSPSAALLFKELYNNSFGTGLYLFISIGAICGLLTTWNGFMMASSQILMAMSRVSGVPNVFAKQDKKYGTPTNALKVSLLASLIGPFLGAGIIGTLTTFSAAGYVASWMITSFSLIKLRAMEPNLKRPYLIPGGVKTAWFSGISMAVLLVLLFIPNQPVYMGTTATYLFVIWMVMGGSFYLLNYGQRNKYSKLKRASFLFASMSRTRLASSRFADVLEDDYRIVSFVVPEKTNYENMNLMELGWGHSQNVFVIKIDRGTGVIVLPTGHQRIQEQDRVFLVGLDSSISKFIYTHDIGEKYTVSTLKDFMGLGQREKQSSLSCIEIKVGSKTAYCGKTIYETKIQQDENCVIIGIERNNDLDMMPGAKTTIYEGDTIWVVGENKGIKRIEQISTTIEE
ncbi:MAG: amino acid permease [Eubacteriales bacterium]